VARRAPRSEVDARPQLKPEVSVALGDAVWRVVAGNAGLMTGPGTNTYLFGGHERTVLDPGPDDALHLDAILAAGGNIRWILATHTHRDHSPLVLKLAQRTGATVIGLPPPRDGRQDESFVPTHIPADGERLLLGDSPVTAIHTPGHASNCVCYLLERERLLFTGDHVLEGVSPVILPPDGDMSAYLASIDKLLPLDFERIAPGHGDVMQHPKRVLGALRAHRIAREDKVLNRLAGVSEATLAALTPLVYDDVPADRHQWARLTLEAHLIKLEREGRVAQRGGHWRSIQA
jgi:glyoxylase-like metal-dependent hydrolase (beta-lactamase superfamily II)